VKILLPTTVSFELPAIDGVEYVDYDVDQPIPAEHEDAEALVAWGNSDAQLADAAARMPRVRWVQTLAAGPDQALGAGFAPDAVITSGRSLHSVTVAEHALALTLAGARSLHTLVRAQLGHRWAGELGGRQPIHDPNRFTTLRGAHVVVWGFGSIAQTLAPMLEMLGARVTGVARSAGERDGYPVVAEADIAELLPEADVLIMILPGTPATTRALDAEKIARLPRHAWVVNVGRGVTVDEPALAAALREQRLGGAALDVTSIEPLPVASELWDLPNVIITPHSAGGRPIGADQLITDNIHALLGGRPLTNVVAR
jgi:phosphoglycerate dehydrogenase-like enzyme